jgi:hypothetical protein
MAHQDHAMQARLPDPVGEERRLIPDAVAVIVRLGSRTEPFQIHSMDPTGLGEAGKPPAPGVPVGPEAVEEHDLRRAGTDGFHVEREGNPMVLSHRRSLGVQAWPR